MVQHVSRETNHYVGAAGNGNARETETKDFFLSSAKAEYRAMTGVGCKLSWKVNCIPWILL